MKALSPSTLSAVAGITALVGSFKALTGALSGVLNNYAHFEKLEMGLTTFFQDADKGKAKFEELRKLSNETTFGVDELTDAFTQMANVGVNVDSIKDRLMMLGNVAQGDKAKFADLVSIYSKIQSTGKAGAMQLQQLALRGLPIYDILKKIGVQGTATGDDITRALQEMTKEGGQFYNAMNNINETIEGKEGFISDYFKEMSVNFATVTGLADSYKKVLDVLREVIGSISDKLLEWNENPMMKALISGLFTTILTGLVSVIGVGLAGALSTVITKLGILDALVKAFSASNPLGWVALGVTAVAGLTAGIVSLVKSHKQATAEVKKQNEAIKEQLELSRQLNSGSRNDRLANQLAILESNKASRDTVTQQYKEALEQKEQYEKVINEYLNPSRRSKNNVSRTEYLEAKGQLEKVTEEVERYKASMESVNIVVETQEKLVGRLKAEVAEYSKFDDVAQGFENIFAGIKAKSSELQNLTDQLAIIEQYKAFEGKTDNNGSVIKFDAQTKKNIDETVEYLQEKINQVKLKLSIENAKDWQKSLMNILGFDTTTASKLLSKNGDDWIKRYANEKDSQRDRQIKTDELVGLKKELSTYYQESAQDLINVYEKLISAQGDFGAQSNGELDNTVTQITKELDVLKESFITAGGKIEDWEAMFDQRKKDEEKKDTDIKTWDEQIIENIKKAYEDFKNAKTELEKSEALKSIVKWQGIQAVKNVASGSDVGNFVDGLEQGGLAGGIINTLVNSFAKVISSVEGFDEVMNFVTTLLMETKPIFEPIIELLLLGIDLIKPVFTAIGEIGEILKPIVILLTSVVEILKPFVDLLMIVFHLVGFAGQALNRVLQPVFDGLNKAKEAIDSFMNNLFGWMKRQTEDEKKKAEEQKQIELMKSLNAQYQSLKDAIKEQEEYYIRKKAELNMYALDDKVTKVNDMILTPNGRFSTNPNDTIIATKNPQGLGSGNVVNNIKVINNAGVDVQTSQRKNGDGMNEILVTISRKIASDVAGGYNGWDSAFAMQQQRVNGRRI